MRITNVLTEQPQPPTEAQVKTALSHAWPYFESLQALTSEFEREWRHYGKKYGWKLRVHSDDKVLFELTVADGWFMVALSLREAERKALLADATTLAQAGEVSADGFLKFGVRDASSRERTEAVVRFLISQRLPE
jgi:hypothetical protein